jgi:hypothetical protein
MLSGAVQGSFSDPNRTYLLYDQVRSSAVHGGNAPHVSEREVKDFRGHVRRTLIQYLAYTDSARITKAGALVSSLDTHPDRMSLVQWLRVRGGPDWTEWLDRQSDSES